MTDQAMTGQSARAPFDSPLAKAAPTGRHGPEPAASSDQALWSLGAGSALRDLVTDPGVTDVLINGPAGVWVDRGTGLAPVAIDLGDGASVRSLAVRLAALAGRRLDDASPAVDAALPGGVRLHAVLPPLAPDGPLISLRIARRQAFELAELERLGTLPQPLAGILIALVQGRANLVICGATGTGKTTLLSALLAHVAPTERIVVIEEAREVTARHPHLVRLEARVANVEGQGAVTLTDLVRHALRMRPDRLVLGECRGAEVREVLSALNTGHEGSFTTVHANTARDVPARLTALGALAGMQRATVAAQAAAGLDVVVHLARGRSGQSGQGGGRQVRELALFANDDDGRLQVRSACELTGGVLRAGPAWQELCDRWLTPGGGAEERGGS